MAKSKSVELKKAKEEDTTNAITTKHGDIFEGYTKEQLEEMGNTTGTEDIPEEDRRPPLYVTNLETIDESGKEILKNLFYDSQSGEQFDTINCSFLGFKKTRQMKVENEAKERIVVCQSFDRKIGMQADGEYRNCEKCKHRFSKKGEKKDCSQIIRFIGWDFDHEQFFVVNAKGSSFVPMNNFLEKNFLNQIKKPGSKKKGDIPLYMIKAKITLKQEPAKQGGFYYVLQPEMIEVNSKEIVMDLLPMAQAVKSMTQQDIIQEDEDNNKRSENTNDERSENINDSDDDVPF